MSPRTRSTPRNRSSLSAARTPISRSPPPTGEERAFVRTGGGALPACRRAVSHSPRTRMYQVYQCSCVIQFGDESLYIAGVYQVLENISREDMYPGSLRLRCRICMCTPPGLPSFDSPGYFSSLEFPFGTHHGPFAFLSHAFQGFTSTIARFVFVCIDIPMG